MLLNHHTSSGKLRSYLVIIILCGLIGLSFVVNSCYVNLRLAINQSYSILSLDHSPDNVHLSHHTWVELGSSPSLTLQSRPVFLLGINIDWIIPFQKTHLVFVTRREGRILECWVQIFTLWHRGPSDGNMLIFFSVPSWLHALELCCVGQRHVCPRSGFVLYVRKPELSFSM